MRKTIPFQERLQRFYLARLHRRERRATWDRAVRAGIISSRCHTIDGNRVVSYEVTPTLGTLKNEKLAGFVARVMKSPDRHSGFDDEQGPPVSIGGPGGGRMLGHNQLLRTLVDSHMHAPAVTDVALAMLAARAIADCNVDEQGIRALMRRGQFRLLVQMPLRDSASGLKSLFIDGIFGGQPGEREEQSWHGLSDSVTVVHLSNHRFAILDVEKADSETEVQRRFDRAIREGDSVVLLAGGVETSRWAAAATDIRLDIGEIKADTVALLIAMQTGTEPTDCIQMVETCWSGGKDLRLLDIAAAVTPLRSPIDIIARLNNLQSYRQDVDQHESAERFTGGKGSGRRSGGGAWIEMLHPVKSEAAPTVCLQKPPLLVEDLHGYGAAKVWALDLKADLEAWRRGELEWADMSTKILLHGIPGTGKSTFARALPSTLQIPMLATSVATWLEPGYLGDVIKRIDQTFRLAREQAPCVVFVDELDGISKRDGGGRKFDEYWINVVNKLLECLDGVLRTDGIVFVGATNRLSAIDPALLRSGRIEEHVQISLPNLGDLIGILKYHLGRSKPGSLVSSSATFIEAPDLTRLCARLIGASGADVEKVVKLARSRARKEQRDLNVSDLEATVDAYRPARCDVLARSFAVHEAGHAVAFASLGLAVASSVSIAEISGGQTLVDLKRDQVQFETALEDTLVALLAGREAERLLLGRVTAGSGGAFDSDLAKATALAVQLEATLGFGNDMPLLFRHEHAKEPGPIYDEALRKRVSHRLEEAEQRARVLVERQAGVIRSLADLLQQKLIVEGEELRAILAPLRQ